MNCEKCKARQVCFIQKQIEGLAERVAQRPFMNQIPPKGGLSMRPPGRAMVRGAELYYKIRGVIAPYCSLFEESDDTRTA